MTASDPRLGEIEGLESRLRRAHRVWCGNHTDPAYKTSYSETADALAYLLAELRKAQDKLARVEGLARSSKPLQGLGGMYSGIVMADHILAAVADATGGGQ